MEFLALIYLIIEVFNIIFTSKFGFSPPMNQPLTYINVRRILIAIRYLLVVVIFFINFNNNFLLGLAFLITPFFVDKAIFQFCKKRERNKLIKLYMSKEGNSKPMSKEDAEGTANTMIAMYSKNKEYAF